MAYVYLCVSFGAYKVCVVSGVAIGQVSGKGGFQPLGDSVAHLKKIQVKTPTPLNVVDQTSFESVPTAHDLTIIITTAS